MLQQCVNIHTADIYSNYRICNYILIMSYLLFKVPTDNDPTTVYLFSDNTCRHTQNLIFECTLV